VDVTVSSGQSGRGLYLHNFLLQHYFLNGATSSSRAKAPTYNPLLFPIAYDHNRKTGTVLDLTASSGQSARGL
jgi:hypothetical protein